MIAPKTFAEFLASLPAHHAIRARHTDWSAQFNEITGGNSFFVPNDDAGQMARLLTATTRLRDVLEDSEFGNLPVVKAYCGLLQQDARLIKVSQ